MDEGGSHAGPAEKITREFPSWTSQTMFITSTKIQDISMILHLLHVSQAWWCKSTHLIHIWIPSFFGILWSVGSCRCWDHWHEHPKIRKWFRGLVIENLRVLRLSYSKMGKPSLVINQMPAILLVTSPFFHVSHHKKCPTARDVPTSMGTLQDGQSARPWIPPWTTRTRTIHW